MNAKNWLVALAMTGTMAVGLWAQSAGAAEVKNVTAKYAWPWGVYINYEVSGTIPASYLLTVKVTDRMKNATYTASTNVLSGDTGRAAGAHRLIWDLDKQGISIQSSNVVFTVDYSPALYSVIDLAAGANASSYPVSYMNEPPSGGFNTDEYKTTKLVLRRIEAGTFTMGSPSGESGRDSDETQHKVTLSKPFYIGLFEMTQKQYALVMGINPSKYSGDKRPVEEVSWNTIRGNSSTYNWPGSSAVDANSFIGRIQKRTGLAFDLPTEAQWEYACRAGTTTAYSYGGSANGDYMWYYSNSDQTHEVGTRKANAWGLYDMHGNVSEWCLDWYGVYGTAAGTDPKGASSGQYRVSRGGGEESYAAYCRSANRNYLYPLYSYDNLGFRLSRILSE